MSRIGKKPIVIPQGTDVSVAEGVLTVKGPLGTLTKPLVSNVKIEMTDGEVTVIPTDDSISSRALWGTFASHLSNMVAGVNTKYQKQLILEGVGFRWEAQGNKLVMQLGFSHPVEMDIPEGIEVAIEKNTLTVSGIDKEKVGQFTAVIRAKKKPEPYKGKGIRYSDEVIIRKEGKKTV